MLSPHPRVAHFSNFWVSVSVSFLSDRFGHCAFQHSKLFQSMATPAGKVPTLDTRRLDHGDCEVRTSDLSPDLWEGLPECLVELILAKLPFSSLVQCCSISKKWRKLILSSEVSPWCSSNLGRLFYFYEGELSVFNSRRSTWEAISLEFLESQFKLLDVVASDGGLLCFCTKIYGEFIVCNPLTKCYKRLLMPSGNTSVTSGKAFMPTPMLAWVSRNVLSVALLVGMVLDSDSGHFKLVVAGIFPGSRWTSLVYDSGTDSWRKGPDIPQGVLYNKLRPIACGGNLYFSFIGGSIGDRMLKYDVKKQVWSWIHMPVDVSFPRKLIEHNGKILLMAVSQNDRWTFEFYELLESRSTYLMPRSPLPVTRVREVMADMSGSGIECVGQGDVMFFIKKSLSSGSPLSTLKINLRVWSHNFSTKADVHSNWEVWGHGKFPLGLYCQVFKPSLQPVK